jgi:ribonuclease HII
LSGRKLFLFDEKLKASLAAKDGFCLIGIDEAGRGPLAGPVVACAMLLPQGFYDERLDDSKKLDKLTRFHLYRRLKRCARWGLGVGQVGMIDSINILQATHYAMHMALRNLLRVHAPLNPDLIAIDGLPISPTGHRHQAIIGGDGKSASIAAASVMAKVFRDKIMRVLHTRFPGYNFHKHKGYGTLEHRERILRFGPSPVHRKSFFPVSAMIHKEEIA